MIELERNDDEAKNSKLMLGIKNIQNNKTKMLRGNLTIYFYSPR